eukprot:TRINITY_DN4567_c0_g1_i4.p1 TRINITY_DN4567_c0_g1~~TRINITY_DN4567_c0_g1_i4.p1  ORF type:complete len:264 (-),score=56.20 TRINITY_DN4567_c0_g1_i4:441-1232(-)
MVGSFETSRNPWFAAPSADIHAFGEIRAYQNSPVHAGMNNPPRNSKVRRDLLAYLAANGITPPQHLSPAAPAPTPQRSSALTPPAPAAVALMSAQAAPEVSPTRHNHLVAAGNRASCPAVAVAQRRRRRPRDSSASKSQRQLQQQPPLPPRRFHYQQTLSAVAVASPCRSEASLPALKRARSHAQPLPAAAMNLAAAPAGPEEVDSDGDALSDFVSEFQIRGGRNRSRSGAGEGPVTPLHRRVNGSCSSSRRCLPGASTTSRR